MAGFYQDKAVKMRDERLSCVRNMRQGIIKTLKETGQTGKIQEYVDMLGGRIDELDIDDGMCYVSSDDYLDDYLHDVDLCRIWVRMSHMLIYRTVAASMWWDTYDAEPAVMSHHNYVDTVIRKGAISAHEGELGIVPLNMRDGSLLVVGKGNPDWNYSLPHGAGRAMSRSQAKKSLDLMEYRSSMVGVYTSSVCGGTLDEAPSAYKDAAAIEEAIEPAGKVVAHLVPEYNFKATK